MQVDSKEVVNEQLWGGARDAATSPISHPDRSMESVNETAGKVNWEGWANAAIGVVVASCFYWACSTIEAGYQSRELALVAAPVVKAMDSVKVDSLKCTGDSVSVVLTVEGGVYAVPGLCPVEAGLRIHEDRTARIVAPFPFILFRESAAYTAADLEREFKNRSVSERQEMFAAFAEQVTREGAKIQAHLVEKKAEQAKRLEKERLAQASWAALQK